MLSGTYLACLSNNNAADATIGEAQLFTDVLDEIASGALRMGIHVQGFASGGSKSLVLALLIAATINSENPGSEPVTMMLLGAGLVVLTVFGRRLF